jgi:hypothetical protein
MNRPISLISAIIIVVSAAGSATAARAQDAQSAQPAPTAAPGAPQTAPKKVWTNDELTGLDPHDGVSTVGTDSPSSSKHAVSGKGPAKIHDARWYQTQISKLQAKIPPLNSQIADLQSAIDGKPTGDGRESTRPRGVKADSWSAELVDLQKKRDDTLAQIGALEDQARHDHVASNTLP